MKGIEDVEAGRVQTVEPEVEVKKEEKEAVAAEVDGNKWYEQLFRKTKEWFEAEPDTEF
jgi:cell division protein FtsA